ncbi:MAG: M36 family metallopeptidase [Pirellulaceae bacterium]
MAKKINNRKADNKKSKARKEFLSGLHFETLEKRELLAGDLAASFAEVAEGEGFVAGELYQVPISMYVSDGMGTFSPGLDPVDVARNHLLANAADFGGLASDFESYQLLSSTESPHTRVTHIVLQQQLNGLPIEGAFVNIAIDNDGRVQAAGSSFVTGLGSVGPETASVEPVTAFASVASVVGLTLLESPSLLHDSGDVAQHTVLSSDVARGDVDLRLSYIPSATGGVDLAWRVHFTASSQSSLFLGYVDAIDGTVVGVMDLVRNASYNVFPYPGQSPEDVTSEIVFSDDLVDQTASPFGWHDTNGILGAEYTDTRGNNVFSQGGLLDGGGGFAPTGPMPDGGEELEFDFPYDESASSTTDENVNAQAVQGFYGINVLHDVYYRYGFNEAAGNYQGTNYTGQGLAGDQIILSVADPDEPDNAYYIPALDGEPGIIVMGTSFATAPDRGLTMDSDVLVHEHGHAVLERLVGGPNAFSAGLTPIQMNAMHEGFADFVGLWFSLDENSSPSIGEASGEYYTGNPDGDRRVKYAHDMAVNPHTFDGFNSLVDPGSGDPNWQEHQGGEIWASVLYDLTWELMFKYGGVEDESVIQTPAFNPDWFDSCIATPGGIGGNTNTTGNTGFDPVNYDTGANNLAMQLILDGARMTPSGAFFTDARDAILAADTALTRGVNHDVIWEVFARRGLGVSADDGLVVLPTDVDAAYDMPPTNAHVNGVAFVDADLDGQIDIGEAVLQDVTIYVDLNGNGTHETLEPWDITDEDGKYQFDFYTGTSVSIKALSKDGYIQTSPTTTSLPGAPLEDGGHDVFIANGVSQDGLNFGFESADNENGIYGTKFNDVNDNGVQDPSETGIEGIYVYIDANEDGRIGIGERAAITDENGDYFIPFGQPANYPPLASGTYQVREVVKHGWAQTTDEFHEVLVAPGISIYDVDFGNKENRDYGDAPESYDGDNPASAGVSTDFMLGTAVDAEAGPRSTANANGDNLVDAADEDGIVFVDPLVNGASATIQVTTSNGVAGRGVLNGWIDFNGNGVFDSSEQVVTDTVLDDGTTDIEIDVPNSGSLGGTYARFRYGLVKGVGPNGQDLVGEVEDYRVGLLDDQPYANDDTFTVTQDDIAVSFDVLANDFGSSLGAVELASPATNPITTDEGGSALVNMATNRIFYTPLAGFSGTDTFQYEVTDGAGNVDSGTVTVHVQPRFLDPEAIDDYQVILDTTVGGETDVAVLDNDIQGAFPPLSIVSWTNGNHGNVVLDGDNLTYVRTDSDPYTLDTFTYTVAGSAAGQPTSTATVTVQLAENVDTVEYIVEALSPLSGLPMADGGQVVEGDQFTLRVSVRDTRSAVTPTDAGVYAAYVDMLYDTDHLQVVPGTLSHGTTFTEITQGNATVPGLVNEVGGVQDGVDQSSFERGINAMELFTIDVIAVASTNGEVTLLETDPVDVTPLHDTVVIAPTPATIPTLEIDYNATSVEILGAEGESLLDTNRDGAVTPIDALGIINQLNTFGTGAVAEGETFGLDQAMDVNRDSFVSPLDALAIINYLNVNASEMGEGEAVEIVEQTTINTSVAGNQVSATEAVSADIIDEYLRVRENEIGLSYFTGGSQDVVEEDSSDLESAIDDLADDVFGQW